MTIHNSTDGTTKVSREKLFSVAVNLMSKTISKEAFTKMFLVEACENESIFDALIRSGKVDNLYEAAAKIGKAFPPSEKYSWNDLAKWIGDYDCHYNTFYSLNK